MSIKEKLQKLTEEQKKKLSGMSLDDGNAYLKSIGIELTPEETAELAALPDDELDEITGGFPVLLRKVFR